MASASTFFSGKSFKRLVKKSTNEKRRTVPAKGAKRAEKSSVAKRVRPGKYTRVKLAAVLRASDGLRVRLPDLGTIAAAFNFVNGTIFPQYQFSDVSENGNEFLPSQLFWDAKSCADRLQRLIDGNRSFGARNFKMKKIAAKDRARLAAESAGFDVGPLNAFSILLVVETATEKLPLRNGKFYDEHFNVVRVDADTLFYSASDSGADLNLPRLPVAKCRDYFTDVENSRRSVEASLLFRRIFALHVILHDIVTWLSCGPGFDVRFAEFVSLHKPIFVVYPRSLAFAVEQVNTLPLAILRSHRRCVFLSH